MADILDKWIEESLEELKQEGVLNEGRKGSKEMSFSKNN